MFSEHLKIDIEQRAWEVIESQSSYEQELYCEFIKILMKIRNTVDKEILHTLEDLFIQKNNNMAKNVYIIGYKDGFNTHKLKKIANQLEIRN